MTLAVDELEAVLSFDSVFWGRYAKINESLCSLNGNSYVKQSDESVSRTIKELTFLFDFASQSGAMPSDNDSLDDLSDSSVKFLLIPAALGGSFESLRSGCRRLNLKSAQKHYSDYIEMCRNVGIGLAVLEDQRRGASDIRSVRVSRSLRQKELKEDVKKLAFLSTCKRSDLEDRDLYVSLAEYLLIDSLNSVRFIEEELTILEYQETYVHIEKVVPKPWTVTLPSREQIAQNVFRPDIPMPTMSLGEFATLEMADLRRREEASRQAEQTRKFNLSSMTEQQVEDEEQIKQRHWDDWKDLNPRGSGNKNRNVG